MSTDDRPYDGWVLDFARILPISLGNHTLIFCRPTLLYRLRGHPNSLTHVCLFLGRVVSCAVCIQKSFAILIHTNFPTDARMEWMKTLTHAEFKACMYELDRRYLADKAEEERRVREQAEADAAADGPNAPKRYFTSFKADTGIDLDAELWEYGIMDGNLKEYRMRIYHERQAKLFESPEHRKTLQDVRVFQMRSAIGH